ncbi:amidohydrolase/deacetylase family metallohydrolase [Terriglobus aquaticus]|uniref:Amidohydrolase/deacetylase family metallohydrolase n=1 Tax=Terriglobus aquaticus TaxID=940139 RepID=A0ABW9KJK6_9BACT|nr:amidohydrolase/deacetylase family metallohydrolase [Terriglobus aquaticus]
MRSVCGVVGKWMCAALLLSAAAVRAQEGPVRGPALPPNPLPYDLLLTNGHVLDDKNHVDMSGDVGIKDGKIAAIGAHLNPKDALKTVDVQGYYITPGLIDLHTHVYTGTGEKNSYAGDLSVMPDGFTLRNGVTTIVDAGSSGWRNFDDFKDRIIDRSRTRVLAELNIVGSGMRGAKYEDNLDDMDGKLTGEKALKFPGVIVGIKSAHFTGPEWKPYDQAQIAEDIAHIPVMIDFGANRIERPLLQLVESHLRPSDIYTHCFSGLRNEQDPQTGGPSKALLVMRQRGIYCDVGHGGGSFAWTVAKPIVASGYKPDSISTDLHVGSMNNGMKDLLNVADKLLVLGETVPEVIAQMTSHPAHEIRQEQYGNLSVGGIADVAVLSVDHGNFGFVDMYNTKMMGTQKLVCQMTVKDGKIVYDLNGLSADMWDATKHSADERQARRWTVFSERPFGATRGQRFPTSTPVNAPPQVQDKAIPKK